MCLMYFCFLEVLTMKRIGDSQVACFEIAHQQSNYSLKVINASMIVFEVSQPSFFNFFSNQNLDL